MLEILKAGEVSAIDYKTGKVRVLFSAGDDKTSDWLNILVPFLKVILTTICFQLDRLCTAYFFLK